MNRPIDSSIKTTNALINAHHFDEPELIPSIFAKASTPLKSSVNARWIDHFFRSKIIDLFRQMQGGHITIKDPIGTETLGNPDARLHCTITTFDLRSYTKVALGGSNGSAQAYIEGLWTVDNLSHLIRLFVSNREILQQMDSGLTRIAQMGLQAWHALFRRNTKSGSRRNIAAHYDLGNEFFKLFLDDKMMYSSALYQEGDDLNTASDRKLQRICDVLDITESDHVVEIGSGWGGFACYAATTTGCKVTTVTISKEQFDEASARVEAENVGDRVTVLLQDYRDIQGSFDKLVSIEMIEAIGHQYLDTYFRKLNHLLRPDGKALIQAIVIDDSHYQDALKEVDFIKRYIFPGGFMPCYSVISNFAAQNRLMLEDLHDMGLSYAQTLRDWRRVFYQQIETVAQQGYDATFQRMWDFYLCYCEGAFDERAISVGQILFRKQAQVN